MKDKTSCIEDIKVKDIKTIEEKLLFAFDFVHEAKKHKPNNDLKEKLNSIKNEINAVYDWWNVK